MWLVARNMMRAGRALLTVLILGGFSVARFGIRSVRKRHHTPSVIWPGMEPS